MTTRTPYRKVVGRIKLAPLPDHHGRINSRRDTYHLDLECGHQVRLVLWSGHEIPPSVLCRACKPTS